MVNDLEQFFSYNNAHYKWFSRPTNYLHISTSNGGHWPCAGFSRKSWIIQLVTFRSLAFLRVHITSFKHQVRFVGLRFKKLLGMGSRTFCTIWYGICQRTFVQEYEFWINKNFHDKWLETDLARTRVNLVLLAPDSSLSGRTCEFCTSLLTWQDKPLF